jgi:hypothetical protein
MSNYIEITNRVRRESETEEWVRKQDAADIVQELHHLQDRVAELEADLDASREPAPCPYIVSTDEGTSYCRLAAEPAMAEPVALATDDDVEALAKQCGWDNRTYMKPAHYAEWCQKMRQFAALARPHALPPGWVPVPVEPTSAMRFPVECWFNHPEDADTVYHAMLAAAPTCPAVSLPDGWPWDADDRHAAAVNINDLADEMDMGPPSDAGQAALVHSIARWLDQSPPTEGER